MIIYFGIKKKMTESIINNIALKKETNFTHAL
jgi:hypothetical protein